MANPRLGNFIRERREQIVSRWAATRGTPSVLDSHVHYLLEGVAKEIDHGAADGIIPAAESARLSLTDPMDLPGVIRELSHLRDAVISLWSAEESSPARLAELRIFDLRIDHAIVQAVEHYLRALDGRATAMRGEDDRRFLDEATRVLASSLDYRDTLECIAELSVPELADWCAVDLLENDRIVRVATTHTDPEQLPRAREWLEKYPVDAADTTGIPQVIRSGEPLLVPEVTDAMIEGTARNPEHAEDLRKIGLRSVMIVPLRARGRTLGAITMVSTDPSRRYGPRDVSLALELGTRGGLAVDNARLYEEAQQAVRLREDVLAIVSHDLRNPLGAIDLGVTMLLQNHGNDSRSRKHLDIIRRSTERMEHLISDLLDMASIEAGRLSLEKRPVDPSTLVSELLDMYAPLAHEKGIQVEGSCAVENVTMLCDRDRIVQMFGNLMSNAIKFCAPGDHIAVRCTQQDHEILFEVADTGPGIAETELPLIFEPYWSAKRHARKGTGLGLYIAKGIVQAHGGRIWVNSVVDQGTTFFIALPIS